MTVCNFLLPWFDAVSSTEKFHPVGVLSNGTTLPVSIEYANARSITEQNTILPFPPLGTGKRRSSTKTTYLPAVECGTPASASR